MPEIDARKQAKLTPEMKARKWKKGQSGNPKGRPKKDHCMSDLLSLIGKEGLPPKYEKLVQSIYPNVGKISHLETLMRVVYHYALKGNMAAVNFIAERTEGKPIQQIDLNQKTGRIVVE